LKLLQAELVTTLGILWIHNTFLCYMLVYIDSLHPTICPDCNNYTVYSENGMFIFKQVCSVCIMEYWCENLWYIILQEGFLLCIWFTIVLTRYKEDIVVFFWKAKMKIVRRLCFLTH